MASVTEQAREARRQANKTEAAAKAKLLLPKTKSPVASGWSASPSAVGDIQLARAMLGGQDLTSAFGFTPKPKPMRLTRQQRAKVRRFVRDSRKRNGRSRRDLHEVQRKNAKVLARDGIEALVFYLQDQGAGAISVHQILHPVVL